MFPALHSTSSATTAPPPISASEVDSTQKLPPVMRNASVVSTGSASKNEINEELPARERNKLVLESAKFQEETRQLLELSNKLRTLESKLCHSVCWLKAKQTPPPFELSHGKPKIEFPVDRSSSDKTQVLSSKPQNPPAGNISGVATNTSNGGFVTSNAADRIEALRWQMFAADREKERQKERQDREASKKAQAEIALQSKQELEQYLNQEKQRIKAKIDVQLNELYTSKLVDAEKYLLNLRQSHAEAVRREAETWVKMSLLESQQSKSPAKDGSPSVSTLFKSDDELEALKQKINQLKETKYSQLKSLPSPQKKELADATLSTAASTSAPENAVESKTAAVFPTLSGTIAVERTDTQMSSKASSDVLSSNASSFPSQPSSTNTNTGKLGPTVSFPSPMMVVDSLHAGTPSPNPSPKPALRPAGLMGGSLKDPSNMDRRVSYSSIKSINESTVSSRRSSGMGSTNEGPERALPDPEEIRLSEIQFMVDPDRHPILNELFSIIPRSHSFARSVSTYIDTNFRFGRNDVDNFSQGTTSPPVSPHSSTSQRHGLYSFSDSSRQESATSSRNSSPRSATNISPVGGVPFVDAAIIKLQNTPGNTGKQLYPLLYSMRPTVHSSKHPCLSFVMKLVKHAGSQMPHAGSSGEFSVSFRDQHSASSSSSKTQNTKGNSNSARSGTYKILSELVSAIKPNKHLILSDLVRSSARTT